MNPVLFADDPQFWFETLRTMGHAAYGGADIGEVLTTAQDIVAGDYDSWHDQWLATADWIAAETQAQLAAGHRTSARDGLMRASNYYRAAEFFLHGNPADPRISHAYHRATQCFRDRRGAVHSGDRGGADPLRGHRPARLLLPCRRQRRRRHAPARRWSCTAASTAVPRRSTTAAPPQEPNGATTCSPSTGPARAPPATWTASVFRPDWENVVTPVLDWVMARPEVDPTRVGLLGLSMGGLLAPRAAAFDHRLAACVANDGVYELGSTVLSHFPGSRADIEAGLRADSAPEVDAAIEHLMAVNPTVRWAITNGMYVMGADTPRTFCASYLDYTLAGGIAEQITCPTLVCDADSDMFWPGQTQVLFDHLTCKKTLLRFTDAEGAGAHCQFGAQRLTYARIYDWLDDTLATGRSRSY